ncbi:hypothetical protein SCLCIDRAFT_1216039 [Scleroderma citrinum Foug A]|uniref:Uncharacterized protein n=1 Tax=Scleroderma citrinum Foug A TaxID=1036808 RepID=A0A0C3DLL4_9AGAM|nr:hypothetical protein SCLCIDRAFT_1216039 [Scleroderma citrinum Foug A]
MAMCTSDSHRVNNSQRKSNTHPWNERVTLDPRNRPPSQPSKLAITVVWDSIIS